MSCCPVSFSVQERILHDQLGGILNPAREKHPRLFKMFGRFNKTTPIIDIERALLFTESMRETEGQNLVLRWAKALMHIAQHITVYIDDDQLIVGRCGTDKGRYGILYPEVDGSIMARTLRDLAENGRDDCPLIIDEASLRLAREHIATYWIHGRSFQEDYLKSIPDEMRHLSYRDKDGLVPRFVCNDTCTWRTCLQWVPDYAKGLQRGFRALKEDALARIDALDPNDPVDIAEKRVFLDAMVMVCDAIILWARRHAELARRKAEAEQDAGRRAELFRIAEICARVPEYPARDLHEAIQAQWFISCFSRLEQRTGTIISNGRMDQYLYPFYTKDKEEGRLTDAEVLELFDCLWCNLAQFVDVSLSAAGVASYDGYAHWEAVTVGGQTPGGLDATNELTYLLLESRRDSPMTYPDLAVRLHSRTPERLLWEVAETIKVGQGYPKLFNDEEIVPLLCLKGVPLPDALDYAASGCTEVRCPNVDTQSASPHQINLCAALEMALHNGRLLRSGDERIGLETGDPRHFRSWEDFFAACLAQLEHLLAYAFAAYPIMRKIRARHFASPLEDVLHDKCYAGCLDFHSGEPVPGGVDIAFFDIIGFATLVDSLAAVKKAVYEDAFLSMEELVAALDSDFTGDGMEVIRSRLASCPTYGNNDPYADSIALEIDAFCQKYTRRYGPRLGVHMDLRQTSVTSNIPHGRELGATPNGRRAGMPVSEGASPSHNADKGGPAQALLSNFATKAWEYPHRAARLLNCKFTPKSVEGDKGTRLIMDYIRTWRDLKLWHLQVNVINRETLEAAQKDPAAYSGLIVRVAGYSAYFTELSGMLQNDIIERTEYSGF